MQVIVGGRIVHYEITGDGLPLLYLHGWGSNGAAFRPLVQKLSGYKHILVDLPGFGASAPPQDSWGLDDYAACINDFLQKIGIKDIYGIISHSNGAAIAIYGLAQHIICAEKLVIFGGAGIRDLKKGKRRLLSSVSKAGKPLIFVLPKAAQLKIRRKWYGAIGSELMMVPGMEETFKKVVAEDVLQRAAQVDIPVLLIYGEEDDATPPLYGELYYQTFPQAQLQIIGGAGHYVFIDQLEKVARQTKEFL